MKVLIKRIAKKANYTIGKLYIDDQYLCDTIEDKDRGLTQNMTESEISKIKVKNETAIPTGNYALTMNVVSPKFASKSWAKPYNGKIPRILDVPGFVGVLIHPSGNTQNDSSGCICVGENKVVGKVINSQITFHKLMDKLKGQKNISITIK